MRKRRPTVASLEEVTIRREGDEAIIDFRDPGIASTHFRLGPSVHRLSDRQILNRFNKVVAAEQEAATNREYVALEIPPGHEQVRYYAHADQWAPRGGVLRCVVDDSGPDGELVAHIDDHALPLRDFGRMLCTYAGWGMRIVFVPEEELGCEPQIAHGDPQE